MKDLVNMDPADHINVLLLEDSEWDAELVTQILRRRGLACDFERVDTRAAFEAALDAPRDIILADYNLPSFNGIEALQIVRERGLDVPFIFVSGSIGEERAVEALRRGATDYVLKDRLTRLPSAIERAIAEHRQARAAREHEQRLEYALKTTNDVVWDWDLRTDVAVMSEALRSVLGYTNIEQRDPLTWWFERMHPEDVGHVRASVQAAIDSGAVTWNDEYRFARADGEWAFILDRAAIIRENGVAVRMVGAMLDITERKLLEQRLEQTHRIESLGRLAATMAHEFNNVLMGVQPVADLLTRRYADNPALARLGEQLAHATQRGRRITSEVLRFGKPARLAKTSFDLHEWLMRVAAEIEPLVSRANVALTIASESPLRIHADAEQLQQIITNLAANAVEAMPGGGQLMIELASDDQQVVLRVIDSGSGMSAATREHIFEPLFTTKKTGNGIGLAVVHQIVTAHGGDIKVESEIGEGTTFTITLPKGEVQAAVDPVIPRLRAGLTQS